MRASPRSAAPRGEGDLCRVHAASGALAGELNPPHGGLNDNYVFGTPRLGRVHKNTVVGREDRTEGRAVFPEPGRCLQSQRPLSFLKAEYRLDRVAFRDWRPIRSCLSAAIRGSRRARGRGLSVLSVPGPDGDQRSYAGARRWPLKGCPVLGILAHAASSLLNRQPKGWSTCQPSGWGRSQRCSLGSCS